MKGINSWNELSDWSDLTKRTLQLDSSSVLFPLIGSLKDRIVLLLASREALADGLSNEQFRPVRAKLYEINEKAPHLCKQRSTDSNMVF